MPLRLNLGHICSTRAAATADGERRELAAATRIDVANARRKEVEDPGWGTEEYSSAGSSRPVSPMSRSSATTRATRSLSAPSIARGPVAGTPIATGGRGSAAFPPGLAGVGYCQLDLGLHFVSGEHAESEVLPADVMEYDGLPGLYQAMVSGKHGRVPSPIVGEPTVCISRGRCTSSSRGGALRR